MIVIAPLGFKVTPAFGEVKAKVPLSEMFGYVTSLRTITSGRASSTMEFDHYEEVPRSMAEEVVKKVKGQKANA